MPKKYGKGEKGDSDSSQSSAHDEDGQSTASCSYQPMGEKRGRGSGQKKRTLINLGASSSRNVPHSNPLPRIDFHEGSPSKRPCAEERRKLFARCGAEDRPSEDSNPALNYPLRNLELGVDESTEVEPNVTQPPSNPSVGSAAEFEQSPEMSHVPVQSSLAHPTSPSKIKDLYNRTSKALVNVWKKMTPNKKEKDVGSSSDKTDLESKQKSYSIIGSPKGKSPHLNPVKSETSSSSGSPVSKKNSDSSTDKSVPSSSASDPNVLDSSPATKSPNKSKKTGSPRVSTGDPSLPRTSRWLNVPSPGNSPIRREASRSVPVSPSKSSSKRKKRRYSLSTCYCPPDKKKNDDHEKGCSYVASRQRAKNNPKNWKNFEPKRSTDSSGTASDPNVEYSSATKSPNKSKMTGPSMVSKWDPSQPGPSRVLNVPSPDNSPNSSNEADRSPNRRSPSRSRSPSRTSPRQSRPRQCICSHAKKEWEPHKPGCPYCWSPSSKR